MSFIALLEVITFTRILPFKLWGLGSCLHSPVSADDRSSLSRNIPFRYWAIFLCCWILQWFSIDNITGNLRKEQHIPEESGQATHRDFWKWFSIHCVVTILVTVFAILMMIKMLLKWERLEMHFKNSSEQIYFAKHNGWTKYQSTWDGFSNILHQEKMVDILCFF